MKFFSTFIVLFSLYLPSKAQWVDTIYLDADHNEVDDSSAASYYKIWKSTDAESLEGVMFKYDMNGVLLFEINYSNVKELVLNGVSKYYHPEGGLKSEVMYLNNKMQGKVQTYYPNGQLKRDDLYENDLFVEGKCYGKTGNDTTHFPYMQLPSYPGGETELYKFIAASITVSYKLSKKTNGGIVRIQFVVDEQGNVRDAEVVQSVHPKLDKLALKSVNDMPRWNFGIFDGEPAAVYYTLPVKFSF
jgi:protein TonB